MANRAYLYASDSRDGNDWTLPDDSEYYDSRHTIPLAWWFLFGQNDIEFTDIHFQGSTWQSLRFVADRLAALDRVNKHRNALDNLARDHLDLRHIEYFIAVLSAWPGQYLLMNPDEILENDPEDDAATISPVLNDLERANISPSELLQRLSRYSAVEPADRADVLIVGCTYGPIASRLWNEMMEVED